MKRAIVVFVENKENIYIEFKALYNSFKYIKCKDTDLVVFCTKGIIDKIPNDCIKVECEAVSSNPIWENYHYVNSIACLTDSKAYFLNDYDLILRCDCDTFLTPSWNDYYPSLYTVGRGAYVNDEETRQKIRRISKKFNLKHKGIFNIGSTHYGNAQLVLSIAELTTKITLYILQNEFKGTEGKWPGWYRGVALLYATEIATNHLVDELIIDGDKLDFGSASHENILAHPHIHCWHTDDRFSKFMFESGKYDKVKLNSLKKDIVCDYCMYMALTSR